MEVALLRISRRNRFLILLVATLLVFTGCNDGASTGVATPNPLEGLVKWQAQLDHHTVEDGLVVAEGTAYVVTWHSKRDDFRNLSPCLCAFDVRTGTKKWAFTYAGSEASAPTVSNGLIFFTVSQPMPEYSVNS